MRRSRRLILIIATVLACAFSAAAQADEVCRDQGETPSRDVDRFGRLSSFVYGRVNVSGADPGRKAPRITVSYSDLMQPAKRQVIAKGGGYCFKRAGTGGILVLEIDGVESARRMVSDIGTGRIREDFDLDVSSGRTAAAPPGVVDSRFSRPPNDKTLELYKRAAAAENEGDKKKAVTLIKQIVDADPDDFIAWTELGSLNIGLNLPSDAAEALNKAIAIRPDYTPALLNRGILAAFEKRYGDAIAQFQRAVGSDPKNARAYRLLGEAYLQDRQGTLGLAALDRALELEPVTMAECHLLKARLYDLAGAKSLASAEYRSYLKKVPDAPEKKRLEQYIRENPAD